MKVNKYVNGNIQTSCKQCGICCMKGGAALHSDDIRLLHDKKILRRDCITLRKGEFAYSPVTDKIEPISEDIIKLRGTGGEWVCCFFDSPNNSCGIYDYRPIACRTLKCWDPKESLAMAGNYLLSREIILKDEKQLLELVIKFENEFPLPDFTTISQDVKDDPEKTLKHLDIIINKDLSFRDKQVAISTQVAEEELFLFGRPVFQLLQLFGFGVYQKGGCLCLKVN